MVQPARRDIKERPDETSSSADIFINELNPTASWLRNRKKPSQK